MWTTAIAVGTFLLAFRRAGRSDDAARARLRPNPLPSAETAAAEPSALGRDASTPTEIPPRGWWAILKRTAGKFSENELMSEAASVTFYALLSLVPAITALVSLYGLVADPSTIAKQLDGLSGVVPSGGMEIVSDQVKRLTQSPPGGLGAGFVAGLLTALWSSNAATKAMLSALNDTFSEKESRGFVKLTAISLAFTLGGIILMLLGLVLVVALPAVFKAIGLDDAFALAVRIGRVPVMIAVLIAALAVLFR